MRVESAEGVLMHQCVCVKICAIRLVFRRKTGFVFLVVKKFEENMIYEGFKVEISGRMKY